MHMCVSQSIYVPWAFLCPRIPKKDVGSPRAGVTGSEPPDVGAGNQTHVFHKNSKCS